MCKVSAGGEPTSARSQRRAAPSPAFAPGGRGGAQRPGCSGRPRGGTGGGSDGSGGPSSAGRLFHTPRPRASELSGGAGLGAGCDCGSPAQAPPRPRPAALAAGSALRTAAAPRGVRQARRELGESRRIRFREVFLLLFEFGWLQKLGKKRGKVGRKILSVTR